MTEVWVFLAISFALIWLTLVSERSQNAYVRWVGRILPPLSLLSLIRIPYDFATAIVWFVAWIIMVVSVITLLRPAIVYTYCFVTKRDKHRDFKVQQKVRPLLAIVCYFIASSMVKMSVYSANAKAIELAFETQRLVKDNGACTTVKPAWANPKRTYEKHFSMLYGEYGTKYSLSFDCDLEQQIYRYWVRINKDDYFKITGKFDGELEATYGNYMTANPPRILLDEGVDLSELAKMRIK